MSSSEQYPSGAEAEPEEPMRPINLVSQSGLAAILGVSKQRVSQLKAEGILPEPFAIVDYRIPIWTEDQALRFGIERERTADRPGRQQGQ